MQEGHCYLCGGRILWAKTADTDTWLPLDKSLTGNITINSEGKAVVHSGVLFEASPTGERYQRHSDQNCPVATSRRKQS